MAKENIEKAPSSIGPSDNSDNGDPSGSHTDIDKSGVRAREREAVTFDTAGLDAHYKPVESYEGIHRYDPKFEWEPEEERRVVRKVSVCRGIDTLPSLLQASDSSIDSRVISDR
jgi:hypothetical protein